MNDNNKSPILFGPEKVLSNLRLSYQLLKDRRVSFWLKGLTLGAGVLYLLSPDLIPGAIDDAGFMYL